MTKLKFLLLAILLPLILVGCGGQPISDSGLAPMYITMKGTEEYVKGDEAKAARLREIATEIREYASAEEMLTIDLLMIEVRRHIRWDKLSPADTALVEGLLIELRTRLVDKYGETPLPENLRMSVETVSGWVILAARA